MAVASAARGVFLFSSPFSAFLLLAELLLLAQAPAFNIASPFCHHHIPSAREVIYKVYLKENRVMKRNINEQLRIKTVYDRSVEVLLPEKKHLIKNKLFPQAISYLEKAFQVRKPMSTVLLSSYLLHKTKGRQLCYDV